MRIVRSLLNAFKPRKSPHPDGMLYDWRAMSLLLVGIWLLFGAALIVLLGLDVI